MPNQEEKEIGVEQGGVEYYKAYGPVTNPVTEENKRLLCLMPSEIRELGPLIRNLCLHPIVIEKPELFPPSFKRQVASIPENRRRREDYVVGVSQPGDGSLPTVKEMLEKLWERNRDVWEKDPSRIQKASSLWPWDRRLIISCGPLSYLAASALKTHEIPARVRAGFANWFRQSEGKWMDHWIVEFWKDSEKRWIKADIDGMSDLKDIPWHDIPPGRFLDGALAWEMVRSGELKEDLFYHDGGAAGLQAIGWQLGSDLGNLMMDEPRYGERTPDFRFKNFPVLLRNTERLKEFDNLALLMADPNRNDDAIRKLYDRPDGVFRCSGLI